MAVESGVKARHGVADAVASGLSKKIKVSGDHYDDSGLRDTINRIVSPETKFQHSIVHSKTKKGSDDIQSDIGDQSTYASKHLSRFNRLEVEHKGITASIYGTLNEPGNPKHGKRMKVSEFGVKGTSGPMMGTNGTFKLLNKQK